MSDDQNTLTVDPSKVKLVSKAKTAPKSATPTDQDYFPLKVSPLSPMPDKKQAESTNWDKVDPSKVKLAKKKPSPPEPLSAPERFASSFTESTGLPADIREWPEALQSLTQGPVPSSVDPTGGALNAAYNMGKGIVTAARDTAAKGLERWNKGDKAGGALQYVESGVPILGPLLSKSGEQFEKGDYAGGIGTMLGTAMQIIAGDPAVRENLASAPTRFMENRKANIRSATGIGDNAVEEAHTEWAKEFIEDQQNYEVKAAETMAKHADGTLEGYLEATEELQKQEKAHTAKVQKKAAEYAQQVKEVRTQNAQKLAEATQKHREKLADVRKQNTEAQSSYEMGEAARKAAPEQAQQISERLPQVRDSALKAAKEAYPKVEGVADSGEVYSELQKSLDTKLKGTDKAPSSLKSVMAELQPKEGEGEFPLVMGEKPGPELAAKLKEQGVSGFDEAGKGEPLTFDKLHGYYSEIGRQLYDRDLPGDEAAALKDARAKILSQMEKLASAEGKLEQFHAAQRQWMELENTFYNTAPAAKGGSPIARALQARDPITGKLRPDYVQQILTEPKANKLAAELLGRYSEHGAPVEEVGRLRSALDVAKASPKALELTPEPTMPEVKLKAEPEPPELPEKPAPPVPDLPPPIEMPDQPNMKEFTAYGWRKEQLAKFAKAMNKTTPWMATLWGVGAVQALIMKHFPYAWLYPGMRKLFAAAVSNPNFEEWLATGPVHGRTLEPGSHSLGTISPLTHRPLSPPPKSDDSR